MVITAVIISTNSITLSDPQYWPAGSRWLRLSLSANIVIGELVKKHGAYKRTNDNGTDRIRVEGMQNLVRTSCTFRLAKRCYSPT